MAVYSRPIQAWTRHTNDKAAPRPRVGLLMTLAFVAALMSLIYLFQVGRVSTQGYQLEQLTMQRVDLERANDQLVFEIAQAQSLSNVRSRAIALGMQPLQTKQTQYVAIKIPAAYWTAQAR